MNDQIVWIIAIFSVLPISVFAGIAQTIYEIRKKRSKKDE